MSTTDRQADAEPREGEEEPAPATGVVEQSDSATVQDPDQTVSQAVQEGERRLDRGLPELLATGAVGGIDVSIGVIALVLITARGGNELVASIGFSLGFLAITLASSELITENFLVPVATVAAGRRPGSALVRLWGGTLVSNLLGGMLVVAMFAVAYPEEVTAAVDIGFRYTSQGFTVASFLRAMLAGLLITLMTWMQAGAGSSMGGKMASALAMGFLIIYSHSNHVVVGTFEVGAAILGGADIGWLELLAYIPWWLLGNLVGGLGLVTVLRFIQVHERTEYFTAHNRRRERRRVAREQRIQDQRAS